MRRYEVRDFTPVHIDKSLRDYPDFLRELLYARGIERAKDAECFLNPDYETHTHGPFLMKDMGKAVERILEAVEHGEKIIIYSDYDHDGIPGGVILYDFFKKIGCKNFENYIPHRHTEGYSLNSDAIAKFAEDGVKLVITVDCGITDVEEVALAQSLGIDVVITDHHIPLEEIPPAYAILNPKQKDDTYPFKLLCGAGVAFKLVQALLKELPTSNFPAYAQRAGRQPPTSIPSGWEKWLLDMVGIATISDMVPLVGENRVFAYYGLKVLRKSPRSGIRALCEKLKISQKDITEDDVGFMITPRINAASRMDRPEEAFYLLSTGDYTEGSVLADHLNRVNDERKGVVASTVKEIKKRIERLSELRDVIVLGNPKWRPALLGLVANSIVEEYRRPVCLWGREGNNIIKGSCRSDGSINVIELMTEVKHLFLDYGGHQFSSGFSISHENVHVLEEKLSEAYGRVARADTEGLFVDRKLHLADVNWDTYRMIERCAPFGEGNPKPIFLFENVLVSKVALFGKENNHLRLVLQNDNGRKVTAISFFSKPDDFSAAPVEGGRIHLIATMEKSTFRNFPELRLRIVDIV